MKDKQVEPASTQARIPLLSAVLHCVSMPALVFLRVSFGFAYLGPKSVFFAFSWALVLFTIYAWNEAETWQDYHAVVFFGAGAGALYWIHLLTAIGREFGPDAEHDTFSGKSHLLRLGRSFGVATTSKAEAIVHTWIEPAAILLAAVALRVISGEQRLAKWLVLTAACLCAKEALNYWHHLRSRKRQRDIFGDADENVAAPGSGGQATEMPKGTRKGRAKRPRNFTRGDEEAETRHAADLLRMVPPYSLEKAEANYHGLIKLEHPDAQQGTEESNARTAELNGAIEYFRAKSGG